MSRTQDGANNLDKNVEIDTKISEESQIRRVNTQKISNVITLHSVRICFVFKASQTETEPGDRMVPGPDPRRKQNVTK